MPSLLSAWIKRRARGGLTRSCFSGTVDFAARLLLGKLGLIFRLVDLVDALLEPADGLAKALPQLRQLRWPEEEQRQREDDQDFAETKPHDEPPGGFIMQNPPG